MTDSHGDECPAAEAPFLPGLSLHHGPALSFVFRVDWRVSRAGPLDHMAPLLDVVIVSPSFLSLFFLLCCFGFQVSFAFFFPLKNILLLHFVYLENLYGTGQFFSLFSSGFLNLVRFHNKQTLRVDAATLSVRFPPELAQVPPGGGNYRLDFWPAQVCLSLSHLLSPLFVPLIIAQFRNV